MPFATGRRWILAVLLASWCIASPASAWRAADPASGEWTAVDLAIRTAWYRRDTSVLEDLLSRSGRQQSGDGFARHQLAYHAIDNIIESGPREHPTRNTMVGPLLDDWRRAHPDSAGPDIVRALLHAHHARFTPNDPDPRQLPTAAWRPHAATLAEGLTALDRVRDRAAEEPHWFAARLQLLILQGADVADLVAVAQEASKARPDYLAPHELLLDHLVTRKGWDAAAVEVIITTWSRPELSGPLDATTYARLYAHLFERHYHDRLFRTTHAHWPYVKDGLRTLAAQWGGARIHNLRAALACLAGDADEAAHGLARMDGPQRDLWRVPAFHEACTTWAATNAKGR